MALKDKKGKKTKVKSKDKADGKKLKKVKPAVVDNDGWGDEEESAPKKAKKSAKVAAKLVDSESWDDDKPSKKGKKLKKVKKLKKGKASKDADSSDTGKKVKPGKSGDGEKSSKLKKKLKSGDGEKAPKDPIAAKLVDGALAIRIRGNADLGLPKYEESDSPFGKIYSSTADAESATRILVNAVPSSKTTTLVSIFKTEEVGGAMVKVLVRKLPNKTAADVVVKALYKALGVKAPRKSKAGKKAKPAKAGKKAAKPAKKGAKAAKANKAKKGNKAKAKKGAKKSKK